MKRKKINHLALVAILISGFIFIAGYCLYPFAIRQFVSVEQANKSNIEKFEYNRYFFQEVLDSCMEVYRNQSKTYMTMDDIPESMQKKMNKTGISNFEVNVENENGAINITAHFFTEKYWYNTVLNNVLINYRSYLRFRQCKNTNNELNARMSTICLGDGWFFEIDTDWL
ncbi:MAG: hypothetical protein LBV74_16515 [Tannerella sp.]|jgi:hypothetical protein|nr:hypothetical protein [Tannerella sp.]